jgi:hypothetical protein
MTTQPNQITDSELVLNCQHSRLREALMGHAPAPTPVYQAAQPLPSSSLSTESKMYLAILVVTGITLFCHTVVSIATF